MFEQCRAGAESAWACGKFCVASGGGEVAVFVLYVGGETGVVCGISVVCAGDIPEMIHTRAAESETWPAVFCCHLTGKAHHIFTQRYGSF